MFHIEAIHEATPRSGSSAGSTPGSARRAADPPFLFAGRRAPFLALGIDLIIRRSDRSMIAGMKRGVP